MNGYRRSLLCCILFCVLILSYSSYDTYAGYAKEKEAVSSRIANTSFLIAEWLKGEFQASDYVLLDIMSHLSSDDLIYPHPDPQQQQASTKFLSSKLQTLPDYYTGVGTADKNCILTHAYNYPPRSASLGFDGSERDWCIEHKNDENSGQVVTPAFKSITGNMGLVQSRAFRGGSKKVAGVVAFQVELSFFSTLIEQVKLDKHGVIAVIDSNMVLLGRAPNIPEKIGVQVKEDIAAGYIASRRKSLMTFNYVSPLDNQSRFYGLRKVDTLPFYVLVGEANEDWLKSWYLKTLMMFCVVSILFIMSILLLLNHWKQLDQAKHLLLLAQTDSLTKTLNRRGFMLQAKKELEIVHRYDTDLAIFALDIDHFKLINDIHGHATGDRAIVSFTKVCFNSLRDVDVFARIGGDEFIILLPHTNLEQAHIVAERIRKAVKECIVMSDDNKPVAMTLSIGVAMIDPGISSVTDMISLVDKALYSAKQKGRNQVQFISNDETDLIGSFNYKR